MQYFAIGSQVGLDQNATGQTARFLVSEGLLEYKPASEAVALTHKGILEAEQQSYIPESKPTDEDFARMAIDEAKLSMPEPDGRIHPKVGVVVVKDGRVLAKAHRGEFAKEHAEYVALERKLEHDSVVGATVYTTLEPCTARTHPKVPCAERLVERGIARVFIGMLDPDPAISGKGQMILSDANIETQFFPRDLAPQARELNRDFIRQYKQKSSARAENVAGSSKEEAKWDVAEITLAADYLNRESQASTFPCRSVSQVAGKYVDDTSADGAIMRSDIEPPMLIIRGIDATAVNALGWKPTRVLFTDAATNGTLEFSGQLRDSPEEDTVAFAIAQ